MTRPMIELLLEGDGMSTVFQPIFDVSNDDYDVWGVEALTRGPVGTHFERASVLFEYVRMKQQEDAADRQCIAAAFATWSRLLPPWIPRLTLNVHACTLERDRRFASYLETMARRYDIDPATLVVEILEQSTYFDSTHLVAGLDDLRSLGVRVAVDDLGLGHGNYRLILDAKPDYLKLDRYFVHRCADDEHRRVLIWSVQQLAANFGATVIAEGVERPEDLFTLRDIGIPLAQGYLLSCPGAPPALEVDPCLRELNLKEQCT